MKALLVDAWGYGGITTCYAHLAHYLTQQGVSCDAFCYMTEWPDAYLLRPYCEQMLSAPSTLTETLAQNHYDIVHLTACCFPYPLSAAIHLRRARFAGGVVVMAQQPEEIALPTGGIDALVGVSETSAEALRVHNRQEVELINNGIDTRLFYPAPPDQPPVRPILAWIGRAGDLRQKDVNGFLFLASALREAPFDFWLVDGSKEVSELMQRLPEWFGSRIRYTHKLPYAQLPDYYRTVAASGGGLISTSAWEANAFTVLEAWACGCPTIVPRAKGFEHAVRYKASLVYERQDALAQILAFLPQLQDPARRATLIANASAALQQEFTVECMGSRYLAIYNRLMNARRAEMSSRLTETVPRAFWNVATKARRTLHHYARV